MSCEIRIYNDPNVFKTGEKDRQMHMTAMVGPEGSGSIQFTINDQFVVLNEAELEDMIETIVNRLACKEGYTATGAERENITFEGV